MFGLLKTSVEVVVFNMAIVNLIFHKWLDWPGLYKYLCQRLDMGLQMPQ